MARASLLVTGGAGFVGSHFTRAAVDAGTSVVVLDDLSAATRPTLGCELVRGDIADRALVARLLRDHAITAVAHFAGKIQVGESVRRPREYFAANLVASLALLDAVVERGCAFLFSSTAAVYGMPDAIPIAETAPLAPINPYGASKRGIEHALAAYGRAYGLRWAALRYFNAAGAHPDGSLREGHEPETHLIPLAIDAALGRRPPLTIFGDDYPTPDGTCIRDYVHVRDLADAHLSGARRARARCRRRGGEPRQRARRHGTRGGGRDRARARRGRAAPRRRAARRRPGGAARQQRARTAAARLGATAERSLDADRRRGAKPGVVTALQHARLSDGVSTWGSRGCAALNAEPVATRRVHPGTTAALVAHINMRIIPPSRSALRTTVVLSTLLAACLPGPPTGTGPNPNPNPGGGSGSNAEAEFLSNVAPMLDTQGCATAGCHIGAENDGTYHFLGQTVGDHEGYYNAILTQPQVYGGGDGNFNSTTALIVTKGPHESPTWWSPSQLTTIEQWLTDEAKARTQVNPPNPTGTTTVPGGQSADTAMAQWAACLTTAAAGSAYLSTQVYPLSQMESTSGRCEACHDPGMPAGEALLNDPTQELTAWETAAGVLTAVALQDSGSGYMMIPADSRFLDKSMELDNGDGTHPSFIWPQPVNDVDMGQALATFVADVNQILLAGQCPAPGYVSQ